MNRNKDLWGEIPSHETIRTPYTILKEQASLLTQKTNGLLIGEVSRDQKYNVSKQREIQVTLLIKAPSLNNYTYWVLEVEHPIQLYPLSVQDLAGTNPLLDCSSEEEFEQALGNILSSQEIKRVISALLAEIHADLPQQSA
jgi:hypothetical protein